MKKLILSSFLLLGCGQLDQVCGGLHTAADAHAHVMDAMAEFCLENPDNEYCEHLYQTGVGLNEGMEACFAD